MSESLKEFVMRLVDTLSDTENGDIIETEETYALLQNHDRKFKDEIKALKEEIQAYKSKFGPLVVRAEPVKCFSCYARTQEKLDLENKLAEIKHLIKQLNKIVK